MSTVCTAVAAESKSRSATHNSELVVKAEAFLQISGLLG